MATCRRIIGTALLSGLTMATSGCVAHEVVVEHAYAGYRTEYVDVGPAYYYPAPVIVGGYYYHPYRSYGYYRRYR